MACVVSDKRRTLIFINVLISCIASTMLATSLTTALPAVVSDLNIPVTLGHWLTSGYTLVMGITTPLTAFLITRFPTKKLYLFGLGTSVFGLLLCTVAPGFPTMMLARGLQACGNGITSAMGQVIVLTLYPPEKRGTAMGWYGLSIGAAPAIAPPLAGILVDTLGWRSIFWFVLAILTLSLLWAAAVFGDVLEHAKKRFDLHSFALSVTAFGGISLGIGNVGGFGVVSLWVLIPLAAGVVCGVLFVRRQMRMPQPFLDLRVFRNRNYTLATIGGMLVYFVVMGATMLMPLYIQSARGYSATVSGLVNLPGALLMAATSLRAGKMYDRSGIKKPLIFGAAMLLCSHIGFTLIRMYTPLWAVMGINLMYNLAVGCLLMPLVTWGTQGLDSGLTPHGTALMNALRMVAGSMGTAVFAGIMTTIGESSILTYGVSALNRGFNMACLSMVPATSALLVIALFFVKATPRAIGAGKEN